MNSTVQCLRHMKDLRENLQPVQAIASNQSTVLTNALKTTLTQLDTSTSSLSPMLFVQILRYTINHQFIYNINMLMNLCIYNTELNVIFVLL